MPHPYDKGGIAYLEGDIFDFKIDTDRKIYVKLKSESRFVWTGHFSAHDLPMDSKKAFLDDLNRMLEAQYIKEKELEEHKNL